MAHTLTDMLSYENVLFNYPFHLFHFFLPQVQPVAELVELSRRWASDGRQIRLNDVIAKGGTLRRTGSLRHRHTKVGDECKCRVFFSDKGALWPLVKTPSPNKSGTVLRRIQLRKTLDA